MKNQIKLDKSKFENKFGTILIIISLIIGLSIFNKNKKPPEGKIPAIKVKVEKNEPQAKVAPPLFKGKEYILPYSNKPAYLVKELARFEENEVCFGDGKFDFSDYLEGKSSLFLASQNHFESKIDYGLAESFNLTDYEKIKLFVNLRSDPENIEEFKLFFTNSANENISEYSISGLHKGWNLVEISVKSFVNLEGKGSLSRMVFTLVSKTSSFASLNLDYVWLEKNDDYLDYWETRENGFLFLKNEGGKIYLASTNINGSLATIKEITSAENYQLITKFVPLKEGFFGLFIRGNLGSGHGYYIFLEGVGSDRWRIFKQYVVGGAFKSAILKEGSIKNGVLEKNYPLWLKVVHKNKKLQFYISFNGEKFDKITQMSDGTFERGELGILNGSPLLLIDKVEFSQ